jgi:hypothetical protein
MLVIQSSLSRGVGPLLSLWRVSSAALRPSTDGSTRRRSSSSASWCGKDVRSTRPGAGRGFAAYSSAHAGAGVCQKGDMTLLVRNAWAYSRCDTCHACTVHSWQGGCESKGRVAGFRFAGYSSARVDTVNCGRHDKCCPVKSACAERRYDACHACAAHVQPKHARQANNRAVLSALPVNSLEEIHCMHSLEEIHCMHCMWIPGLLMNSKHAMPPKSRADLSMLCLQGLYCPACKRTKITHVWRAVSEQLLRVWHEALNQLRKRGHTS